MGVEGTEAAGLDIGAAESNFGWLEGEGEGECKSGDEGQREDEGDGIIEGLNEQRVERSGARDEREG